MIRVSKLEQMNMIFEGNTRDLNRLKTVTEIGGGIDPDDASLPVVKTTDDPDEIREYLDWVSDRKSKRSILVLMRIPHRTSGDIKWDEADHVMVGPTFAALLLKDYDLAGKLVKWEKKLLLTGCVLRIDELSGGSGWISTGRSVCIQERFVVDHHIPDDLVTELDRKIRQKGEYCLFRHMYTPDYLGFTGKEPGQENLFYIATDNEKPYVATVLERLRREYPIVYESFLTDILQINRSGDSLKLYLNARDYSAILRMICRYRPEEKEDIFRWFKEETRVVRSGRHHMFYYSPLPKRYINDTKMLYGILKNCPAHFAEFMKIVTFLAMESNDEELLRIVKRAIRDKNLGLDPEVLTFYLWDMPEGDSLHQEIRNEYSNVDYLDYLANLMILYRKIRKERFGLSSESEIMRNFYSAVINNDALQPWSCAFPTEEDREEATRILREKMKRFLSSIDRIICDDFRSYLREAYEKTLMEIGDEELIIQGFESGLLRRENGECYIHWAVKSNSIQLIPAITAFSE